MTEQEKIDFLFSQKHKPEVDRGDWLKVNKNLIDLAVAYVGFCILHNIEICFTSIIRPMIPGVSKTNIHSYGRAFDASAKGWTTELMDEFIFDGNKRFENVAAISNRDSVPRAFIFHGDVLHLHAQVRP